MTQLSDADWIKQTVEKRRKWMRDRGFPYDEKLPDYVMRYIEQLEARLAIAVPALQSIATPALGGKIQQYTAQHALEELKQHEREEAR